MSKNIVIKRVITVIVIGLAVYALAGAVVFLYNYSEYGLYSCLVCIFIMLKVRGAKIMRLIDKIKDKTDVR